MLDIANAALKQVGTAQENGGAIQFPDSLSLTG
jgi:hypothetical protein